MTLTKIIGNKEHFQPMQQVIDTDSALSVEGLFLTVVANPFLAAAYGCSLVCVMAAVVGIFFNRGPGTIIGILTYLLSLSTITLSIKNVYQHQFEYPLFLTSICLFWTGVVCFGIMYYNQVIGKKMMAVPTYEQQTRMILPIALAFTVSIGANNLALQQCSAAFSEMIGAASPLCVIAIALSEGKAIDIKLLMPVLAVIGGVCLCAVGELNFTWLAFGLVFLSAFLRGYKTNVQHKIMDNDQIEGDKLDPIELLAWMSPPCLAMMVIWSGVIEGFEPLAMLAGPKWLDINLAIGLTVANACFLNVANNFVIRDLGAIGCLIAGQLKGILVLMGAVVLLGEVIQMQQIIGYVVIAAGVYFYNKTEKEIKDAERIVSKSTKEDLEATVEKAPLVKK